MPGPARIDEAGLSDTEAPHLLVHEARLYPRDHAPFPGLPYDPFSDPKD